MTIEKLTMALIAVMMSSCAVDAADESAEEPEDITSVSQGLSLPDLVVESVSISVVSGNTIRTVVIKNQGTAATGSMAAAFKQTLIDEPGPCFGGTWAPSTVPIAAGASKTFTSTIGWNLTTCGGTWKTETDHNNVVAESDETNNLSLVPNN